VRYHLWHHLGRLVGPFALLRSRLALRGQAHALDGDA
jgi:hypothetical protein